MNAQVLTVTANGVRYHVEVGGSGDPLVLLHGFTGSSANWSDIRPQFEQHFTTITIDLPGHGQTASPADAQRYQIERAAEDVQTIIHQLALSSPVHLLGYSMGARLALYFALTYPDSIQSLILESTSPGLKTDAERDARRMGDEQLTLDIEDKGIAWFVDYWTNIPLFSTQNETLRARLKALRMNNNPQGLSNSLRGMGTGMQPSLWERLAEFNVPTLLITGEHDRKYVAIAEQMAALIPNASSVILPDAGHTVHAEQPDSYTQTVVNFILGNSTV